MTISEMIENKKKDLAATERLLEILQQIHDIKARVQFAAKVEKTSVPGLDIELRILSEGILSLIAQRATLTGEVILLKKQEAEEYDRAFILAAIEVSETARDLSAVPEIIEASALTSEAREEIRTALENKKQALQQQRESAER